MYAQYNNLYNRFIIQSLYYNFTIIISMLYFLSKYINRIQNNAHFKFKNVFIYCLFTL